MHKREVNNSKGCSHVSRHGQLRFPWKRNRDPDKKLRIPE